MKQKKLFLFSPSENGYFFSQPSSQENGHPTSEPGFYCSSPQWEPIEEECPFKASRYSYICIYNRKFSWYRHDWFRQGPGFRYMINVVIWILTPGFRVYREDMVDIVRVQGCYMIGVAREQGLIYNWCRQVRGFEYMIGVARFQCLIYDWCRQVRGFEYMIDVARDKGLIYDWCRQVRGFQCMIDVVRVQGWIYY